MSPPFATRFGQPYRTGRRKGATEVGFLPNIAIVQVVKQRQDGHLNISRRIVQGTEEMVQTLIRKTQARA